MELVSQICFEKHKIDAKTYRDSYKYYISNPEEMDDILQKERNYLDKDPEIRRLHRKRKRRIPNLQNFKIKYQTYFYTIMQKFFEVEKTLP